MATDFQINPQSLVVFEDSGIRSLKDLEGKSIDPIPDTNTTLFVPPFLKQYGVDPDKVTLVNTDPANLIPSFLSKRVDVSTALINVQPIVFEAQGQQVRSFLFADGGINALSVGIGVHANTIRDRGDLIRRFLTATNLGGEAAMKDPDAGVDAMMKLVPNLNKTILLGQFRATVPLLHTERTKGGPPGRAAKGDLDATIAALVQVGTLKGTVSTDALYTNEHLP